MNGHANTSVIILQILFFNQRIAKYSRLATLFKKQMKLHITLEIKVKISYIL